MFQHMTITTLAFTFYSLANLSPSLSWNPSEIIGYHFHTYFFQTDTANTQVALTFRKEIQKQIDAGFLKNCRLNHFNTVPIGPHPIGSYETCCNASSISQATSWFMLNHGNLSILLHPLTRFEYDDHTARAMWLGHPVPLDLSGFIPGHASALDQCLPVNLPNDLPRNGARRTL